MRKWKHKLNGKFHSSCLLSVVSVLILCLQAVHSQSSSFIWAVEWQNNILINDGRYFRYAVQYVDGTATLVRIAVRSGENVLAVANDPSNTLSVCLVQKEEHQFVKIHSKKSPEQVVPIPTEVETKKSNDRWLFASNNCVHIVRRNKADFIYAVFDGHSWQIKLIKEDTNQPPWSQMNYLKRVILSTNGLYCASSSGEWGSGVLYFDFKTQNWTKIFGFESETDQRSMWVESEPNGCVWIVSGNEIQKFIDGKLVSTIKISELAEKLSLTKLLPIYLDSRGHLYLQNSTSEVFELAEKSLTSVFKSTLTVTPTGRSPLKYSF